MYKITLRTWYPETPDKSHEEVYYELFETMELACKYLGDNHEKMLDEFPVESIKIEYSHAK